MVMVMMVIVMVMVMVILNILQVTLGRVDGAGQPMSRLLARFLHFFGCFLCFISGVVIFCIRIKYRLFAGQGEGKSFTDARQVKILFHHNMNKSKNMIIMSCCHVDSTLLIHNKMPSHHRCVMSKRILRFKRKVSTDSESGDSFVLESLLSQ